MKISKPWWRTDRYDLAGLNDGPDMGRADLWGPKGPALVPYFPATGKTGEGWGQDTFMPKYNRLEFSPRRVLYGVEKGAWDWAWVMRGARMICIDIDGKNGGFDHASKLGFLPATTAEVSMSGNGYHLFYEVDDEWDEKLGFGRYRDVIGLVTGVDIRGTGCVFHKTTQRWNATAPAKLPEHLSQQLLSRQAARERSLQTIIKTKELDPVDIAIMHDELMTELKKPMKPGTRNQTLFAIGSQMMLAEVPNWEKAVLDRANELGLDSGEGDKLVANIENYGSKQP